MIIVVEVTVAGDVVFVGVVEVGGRAQSLNKEIIRFALKLPIKRGKSKTESRKWRSSVCLSVCLYDTKQLTF